MTAQTLRIMDIVTKTAPAEQPVTLEEAKEYLRVDSSDQDAQIGRLISAAVEWAEDVSRSAFVTRTLTVTTAGFPPQNLPGRLPSPPIQEVEAVRYTDTEGNSQTLDVQTVRVDSAMLGEVGRTNGENWPETAEVAPSVEWDLKVGVGAAADVREVEKTAILVAVDTMFELRVDQVAGTVLSRPQVKNSARLLGGARARPFG